MVDHQHAVAITVKTDAQVSAMLDNGSLQRFHVGGAAVVIDVEPVGGRRQHGHLGAKLTEHVRRHFVCCTVGTVDNELQPLKISTGRNTALTKFDIPARSVVDTRHFAQLI